MEFNKISWELIRKYFESDPYILTRHHLDSFNEFLDSKIKATIKRNNPLKIFKGDVNKINGKYTYEIEVFVGGENGENIFIDKPVLFDSTSKSYKQLYPNEARLKNLTYASNIYADVLIKYVHRSGKVENNYETRFENENRICLGKIPIMLHSKYCILNRMPSAVLTQMGEDPNDKGGYFIISGKEKVIISQERRANNLIILEKLHHTEPFCCRAVVKSTLEYSFLKPQTFIIKIKRDTQKIYVQIPYLRNDIPLFILFRALGVVSDKEIIEHILYTSTDSNLIELLRPSIEDTGPIFSQEDALNFISSFKMKVRFNIAFLYSIFDKYMLPHIDTIDDNKYNIINKNIYKCYYMGYMVNKLLKMYTKQTEPTDKDSFSYKRIELSGTLLAELFSDYYETEFLKGQRPQTVERKIGEQYEYKIKNNQQHIASIDKIITNENKHEIFNQNIIENALIRSLKGSWGKNNNRPGIVQDLNRVSFLNTVSMLRRLHLPLPSGSKVLPPRKLHSSQWGMCCPNETPDGGNIGIIKSMAISSYITSGEKSDNITKVLFFYDVVGLNCICPIEVYDQTKIIVNGKWIGIHRNPDNLVKKLLIMRKNNIINLFTSISWNIKDMEININTDDGRFVRPLIVIEDRDNPTKTINLKNISNKTWNQLILSQDKLIDVNDFLENEHNYQLSNTIIEYLDNDEINNNVLLSTYLNYLKDKNYDLQRFTHCEIHPSFILGLSGLCIPFSSHNQSPRNLLSITQSRQAIGVYATNYRNRMDQSSNILHYPQKAITNTRYTEYFGPLTNSYGQNAVVAIMSYTGYNQEDSVIINESSVQRGLFNHISFKTYSEEIIIGKDKNNYIFTNPSLNGTILKKGFNYSKLNKFGIINEGEKVNGDDVIIGRVVVSKDENGNDIFYDHSIVPEKFTDAVVDKIFISSDNDKIIYKVRLRSIRIPTLGDKFASRHGQKGVVGMMLSYTDMPYNKDGIVPDIIINPHAIPSRMTIGHLIETVFSRDGSLDGKFIDSTAFTTPKDPINKIDQLFPENISKELDAYADDVLYNGYDGSQLKCKIFMGPIYYMRLKQLVKDKVHSRGKGQVSLLTRQPTEGRARDGGLRIGEMERDCLIAHGISDFLQESFTTRSDEYKIFINKLSGLIEPYNPPNNVFASNDYSLLQTPYCLKLLLQELQSMNIILRLIT